AGGPDTDILARARRHGRAGRRGPPACAEPGQDQGWRLGVQVTPRARDGDGEAAAARVGGGAGGDGQGRAVRRRRRRYRRRCRRPLGRRPVVRLHGRRQPEQGRSGHRRRP
ncbi:hypothetical protein BN1723_020344, partial [Verticillium longisporum]